MTEDRTESNGKRYELKGWKPPSRGWVEFNTDGAVSMKQNKSSCGGVLHDSEGLWIVGFSLSLGNCSPFEAEEWAIFQSLRMGWDMGFKKIQVESDCQVLVNLINGENDSSYSGSFVFLEIQSLLQYNWSVKISYIPREKNLIVDYLAKEGDRKSVV